MPLDEGFIKKAAQAGHYELSLHADEERLNDHLTIAELEEALASCEIIEQYTDDPRGESCLALGFCRGKPIHVVCGKRREGKLFLITVYIPAEPKWKDPRTRQQREDTP